MNTWEELKAAVEDYQTAPRDDRDDYWSRIFALCDVAAKFAHAPALPFRPMSEMPDELRDGREVLLRLKPTVYAQHYAVCVRDSDWWREGVRMIDEAAFDAFCALPTEEGHT